MNIHEYKDLKGALDAIISIDQDWIILRHRLGQNETVRPHYHEKANEYLVIDNGEFVVAVGEEKERFHLTNRLLAIHFPPKEIHALSAFSPLSYIVIRDQGERTQHEGNP